MIADIKLDTIANVNGISPVITDKMALSVLVIIAICTCMKSMNPWILGLKILVLSVQETWQATSLDESQSLRQLSDNSFSHLANLSGIAMAAFRSWIADSLVTLRIFLSLYLRLSLKFTLLGKT